MLLTGASALITLLPVNEPCPIACPTTLYSINWSIIGLARMSRKKIFNFSIKSLDSEVDPHMFPQKIVNTSTFARSGPLRYVSSAVGGAEARTADSGKCNGTARTYSPSLNPLLLTATLARFLILDNPLLYYFVSRACKSRPEMPRNWVEFSLGRTRKVIVVGMPH